MYSMFAAEKQAVNLDLEVRTVRFWLTKISCDG